MTVEELGRAGGGERAYGLSPAGVAERRERAAVKHAATRRDAAVPSSGGALRAPPGLAGPHQGVRRRTQARPGAELPHRRQHPGGHPGPAGVRVPTTWSWRSAPAWGCSRRRWPGWLGTCTPSRSTEPRGALDATLQGRSQGDPPLPGRAQGAPGGARARSRPCAPAICRTRWPVRSSSSRCSGCRACGATA